MIYRQVQHKDWLQRDGENVEISLVMEISAVPKYVTSAFGQPEPLPESYELSGTSGEFLFVSDDQSEFWSIYDMDATGEMSNGETGPTPEQFWNSKRYMTLHLAGLKRSHPANFFQWLFRRLDGERAEEVEVFKSADHDFHYGSNIEGLEFQQMAIYTSPRDSKSCYELANDYCDMYDDQSSYCSVDYLKNEMEHYTSGEYEGTGSPTELELLDLCKKLETVKFEFVIIKRGEAT